MVIVMASSAGCCFMIMDMMIMISLSSQEEHRLGIYSENNVRRKDGTVVVDCLTMRTAW